jgi:hypothetical protein
MAQNFYMGNFLFWRGKNWGLLPCVRQLKWRLNCRHLERAKVNQKN